MSDSINSATIDSVFSGGEMGASMRALRDLPFTLIYLLDADGKTLSNAAETGFTKAHAATPPAGPVDGAGEAVWVFSVFLPSSEQPPNREALREAV